MLHKILCRAKVVAENFTVEGEDVPVLLEIGLHKHNRLLVN